MIIPCPENPYFLNLMSNFEHRKLRILVVFILCFFVLPANFAFAGWYIVEKSEDRYGNLSYQSTFIQDGWMRIENNQSTIILDVNTGEMTMIFSDRSTYWSGSYVSLRTSIISHFETQLKVSIAQLPSQERQIAETEYDSIITKMKSDTLIKRLPEAIRITPYDSLLTISGYKANGYQVMIDTIVNERIWITNQIEPYQSIDLHKVASMTQIFTKPSSVTFYRQSEEYFQLIQKGVVLKSVIPTPLGDNITLTESIREVPIPNELFRIPSGYRKITVEELISYTMEDGSKKDEATPSTRPTMPGENFDLYQLPEKK